MQLEKQGYAIAQSNLLPDMLRALRERIFIAGAVGTRCLLDVSTVKDVAIQLRTQLSTQGLLSEHAVAIQAIAFDKNPQTNWKVPWHQDLMFPFASPVSSVNYDLACIKDGVNYARPPVDILESLTAVRLHLDDCDQDNGPLRISPCSHVHGIINSNHISDNVKRFGEVICLAREGDVLLMKVLALHSSSTAKSPNHRRVLHFVYYSGKTIAESWHREV